MRSMRRLMVMLGMSLAALSPTASADPFPKDKFIQQMLVTDPPADDSKLVPGWRIGAIHLGMTVADLIKAGGTPDKTYPNGPETHYVYTSGGHRDVRVEDGRVSGISSGTGWAGEGPREHTIAGITNGTPEIELVAAMGKPSVRMFSKIPKGYYYCYFDAGAHFFVDLETSRVTQAGVQTKKGMKEWCE